MGGDKYILWMPITLALLIAAAIIAVYLLLTYAGSARETATREKYRALFDESNGTFDASAQAALRTIGELQERTPVDSFTAARILELNEGDAEFNHNRQAISALYGEALRGLDRRLAERQAAPMGDAAPFAPGEDPVDPVFLVDYIGGFVDRNAADLQPALVEYYADLAPRVHTATARERISDATRTAKNKAERVEQATEALQTHTPDAQNSHDSAVNVGLRNTLETLRTTTRTVKSFNRCADEFREYVNRKYAEDHKRPYALSALEVIAQDAYNSTIRASEQDVFRVVWSRADENINTDDIRDSIVHALDDFYDRRKDGTRVSHSVCINGRDSRMLSALATLDRDPQVGAVQTVEQHKNDVMHEVKQILDREIENAGRSEDVGLRQVAQSYRDLNVEATPQDEQRFRDIVRKEIDVVVDAKRDVLVGIVENVRQDAYAAVG